MRARQLAGVASAYLLPLVLARVAYMVASAPQTGGAPSGPAGGDLTGTYPNPEIAAGAVTPTELSFDPATQAELDAHLTDASDAHAGSAITNTPAGNIAATTLQGAVNELDAEKAALSHTHSGADITSGTVADARIASTIARDTEVTAAVAASEAGQVRDGDAAGGVLGGTYPNPSFAADMATQAELDAVAAASVNDGDAAGGVLGGTYPNPSFAADMATQAEFDAHVNDTTDAHDASTISFVPTGTVAATNVQDAIAEAAAEAGAAGAPTNADYLVGTAQGGLSAEIVVGTSPGGELGGTWASPTVDATHSGSSHAGVQAAAEATAAAALAAHTSDASDAHDASAVSFVPAGTIAATDVQAAIEEVATEAGTASALVDLTDVTGQPPNTGEAPVWDGDSFELIDVASQAELDIVEGNAAAATATVQTNLDAHIADSSDAHDASAISIADVANDFTATNVEDALAELQSDAEADDAALAAHLADTVDAHDASAISSVAAGTLASTDVQAALNELDTEKVPTTRTITAGSGLAGGGTLAADRTLDVNVDASTIEINADTLRVKADGITANEIAANAVGSSELADNAVDTNAIQANAVTAAKVAADVATQAELDAHEADTTSVHGITDTSTLYRAGGTDVALADGGTGASLVDPNADRMLFWDDSAGAVAFLAPGTNLTITGTTIDATAGGGSALTVSENGTPVDATVTTLDFLGADFDLTESPEDEINIALAAAVYKAGGTDVALADGGTGASLVDPNADRIMFWDDSAGAVAFLAPGTGLTITGTTIDASAAGGAGDVLSQFIWAR